MTAFYIALGLVILVSGGLLVWQWWTWEQPEVRLSRDLRARR